MSDGVLTCAAGELVVTGAADRGAVRTAAFAALPADPLAGPCGTPRAFSEGCVCLWDSLTFEPSRLPLRPFVLVAGRGFSPATGRPFRSVHYPSRLLGLLRLLAICCRAGNPANACRSLGLDPAPACKSLIHQGSQGKGRDLFPRQTFEISRSPAPRPPKTCSHVGRGFRLPVHASQPESATRGGLSHSASSLSASFGPGSGFRGHFFPGPTGNAEEP